MLSYVLSTSIIVVVNVSFLFMSTDLRTQAMYQCMDKGFVGLIFSCFNTDPNMVSALLNACSINSPLAKDSKESLLNNY